MLSRAGSETEVRGSMLLGFKKRFEAKILAKEKRHTIRDRRKGKRQIRVGDRLDCYVNPRQKSMRLLGRWPCTKVQDIEIHWHPGFWIVVDGEKLSRSENEQLARADGFRNFVAMLRFWEKRLPFSGVIIHWDPDRPQDPPRTSQNRAKLKLPAKIKGPKS
jgi:hypothetical protein